MDDGLHSEGSEPTGLTSDFPVLSLTSESSSCRRSRSSCNFTARRAEAIRLLVIHRIAESTRACCSFWQVNLNAPRGSSAWRFTLRFTQAGLRQHSNLIWHSMSAWIDCCFAGALGILRCRRSSRTPSTADVASGLILDRLQTSPVPTAEARLSYTGKGRTSRSCPAPGHHGHVLLSWPVV